MKHLGNKAALKNSAIICLLLFGLGSNVSFAQFNLGLTTSVEHIDNPLRMNMPVQSDFLSSFNALVELARQTQRFDTSLSYNANRLEYREDQLSDQSLVSGEGSLTWKAVEDLLNWSVSNSRYNQLIDVTQPDTIDNRQVINYNSTGPSLTLPIGSANFIRLNVQEARVDYGESEALNQRRGVVSASYTRIVSGRLSVGANASFTETEYKQPLLDGYKFLNLIATANLTGETYSLNLETGEYSTKRAGVKSTNPILTVSGSYNLNSRLSISAEYSESVQDLLSDVRGQNVVESSLIESGIELENRVGNSNTGSIYERKGESVGITYADGSVYSLGIRYSNNIRSLLGTNSEEKDERLSANFQYSIGPKLSVNASSQLSELDFTQARGLQERMDFRLGFLYRLSNQFSIELAARRTDQKGEVIEDTFDGNSYLFGLTYRR